MHVLYTSIREWLKEPKPYLNDIGGITANHRKYEEANYYAKYTFGILFVDYVLCSRMFE